MIKKDGVLHLSVNVTVRSELDGSTPVAIGTWASANVDGSGRRTGYSNQVCICVFGNDLTRSPCYVDL